LPGEFCESGLHRAVRSHGGVGAHRRCWSARNDLRERWPSRLVATAAEDRRLQLLAALTAPHLRTLHLAEDKLIRHNALRLLRAATSARWSPVERPRFKLHLPLGLRDGRSASETLLRGRNSSALSRGPCELRPFFRKSFVKGSPRESNKPDQGEEGGQDFGSHRRCWPARSDLRKRWSARLVATAAEDRLSLLIRCSARTRVSVNGASAQLSSLPKRRQR
jgi:hypothetical protein